MSATGMPGALDGIDIDSGLQRVAGNVKLYQKILHKFRKGHIASAEEISQALDLGDAETAHRIAHTVKGVAGNLGADDLQAAAKRVDAAFKANESESVRALLPAFEAELLRVARAIDSAWPLTGEVSDPESVALDELDIPAVKVGLDKLESLLRNNDFEAQDALDALASAVANSHLQEGVSRIAEQLGQYDFDRALEELRALRQNLDG
jgi:HPt (histidine-containing phosphotransfer) domain-containing protein